MSLLPVPASSGAYSSKSFNANDERLQRNFAPLLSRGKEPQRGLRATGLMTQRIHVSVLNRSTCVDDDEINDFVSTSLQTQVSDHFFEAWNVDAEVKFAQTPPAGAWWLVILDDTDQDGWFGYHLTDHKHPLAKVFARTIRKDHDKWTVSASHELLEMLADPTINRMVSTRTFNPADLPTEGSLSAKFHALEICDPVTPDAFGYKIGKYTVSDFVLPSWFDPHGTPPFDHNRQTLQPFGLLKGGYCGVYSYKHGWRLVNDGSIPTYREIMKHGGRTWLRTQPRHTWQAVPAGLIETRR
jgi:hypothetical protein